MVVPAARALTGRMDEVRTQVAIIGAGPAGMLLSHLLAAAGVDSVVLETRSEEYVASRIRAGILEQSTVDLLRSCGLGERLDREGDRHRGIYLQWPEERHHIDFEKLTGRSVWVYGQTEVQKDLVAAREADGQRVFYEIEDTALHDLETDRPSVTFTDADGVARRVVADAVAGCDGSFGPSRAAVPETVRRTWEKVYPYSWLGVLADVAPSTDELDLRLAPGRVRPALDAVGDASRASTSRSPTTPRSSRGPTSGSGTHSPPAWVTGRTGGP